jgi:hypothetical protein
VQFPPEPRRLRTGLPAPPVMAWLRRAGGFGEREATGEMYDWEKLRPKPEKEAGEVGRALHRRYSSCALPRVSRRRGRSARSVNALAPTLRSWGRGTWHLLRYRTGDALGGRRALRSRQPFRSRLPQAVEHHRFGHGGVLGESAEVGPCSERRVQG